MKEVKLANETNTFEVELRIDSNKNIPVIPLTINGLNLKFSYQIGDKVDHDCPCDSKYMTTMQHVGITMMNKYHWVANDAVFCIIIDNAGGHGTDDCVNKYTSIFITEFNIEIIHQALGQRTLTC